MLAMLVLLSIIGCGSSANTPGQVAKPDVTALTATEANACYRAQLDALARPQDLVPADFEVLKQELLHALQSNPQLRTTAAVPASLASQVTDLKVYRSAGGNAYAMWTYANQGDYDQNSEVNIADLTPVGIHLARTHEWSIWPSAEAADGDTNGEINISDLTAIGQNFMGQIDSYVLEATTNSVDGIWEAVSTAEWEDSSIPAAGSRRRFYIELPAGVAGTYYRVVPLLGEARGIPSLPFQYEAVTAPLLTISGVVLDGTGAPMPGVTISSTGLSDVITGADGSFSITGLAEGFCGILTAAKAGHVFVPCARSIYLGAESHVSAGFRGFMLDEIRLQLPDTVEVGSAIQIELQALDAADQLLTQYGCEARLSAPPQVNVLAHPWFSAGVASAVILATEPGEYALELEGIKHGDSWPLGSINIVEPANELEITMWQGGAEAAISLTFDDGTADHWSRGMPLWEEYGFRVTLGIVSSRFEQAPERIPQLTSAVSAGHELANHTRTHPDLAALPQAEMQQELQSCNDFLLENVVGLEQVYSCIYPYEMFSDEVIATLQSMGYICARSGSQGISDYAQLNYAPDPPFFHLYSWANLDLLPMWMWDSTTDWAVNHGGWLVEQCHGIGVLGEPGVGWSPRPESDFRAHYEHLKSFGSRIWVAPLSEVARYVHERNAATLSTPSFNGNELSFALSDNLDDDVYNIPLTVALDLPAGWTAATATQNSAALASRASSDGTVWLVDCVPDAGAVIVRKQ